MNVDPPTRSKKRRATSNVAAESAEDPEAGAYNENAKDRFKQLQEDAAMEFEDDLEDEFDEEELPNLMDVEEAPEEEPEDDIMQEEEEVEPQVWRPGIDQLEEGEYLEYDPTAYELIHFMKVDAPCLSFDILADNLGFQRQRLPHTAYIVTGSQAPEEGRNKITVMKMSKMHKTKYDGQEDDPNMDDEEDADDDEEFDEEAQLETQAIDHEGGVNRIRAMPQRTNIVASMADTGKVHIFDLAKHIKALDFPSATKLKTPSAMFSFTGHTTEGFALDWSSFHAGRLATADCNGGLHVWDLNNAATWNVSDVLQGHQGSIEDLQWSSNEADILASTGVDRTLRIWDTRERNAVLTIPDLHQADVNVIHWNTLVKNLIVSGGDDGVFKVWDLEKPSEPLYTFAWHQMPITSIEWSPIDPSVLVVASEDNSATVWDVTLTKDPNEQTEYPPQLLFMHQGQKELKEVHWHKQIPDLLISTAADGFNVWKPSLADQ